MYTLTLSTTPPLAWTEPDLISVGTEQSAINGEVPNMTVAIDNSRGQHTAGVAALGLLRRHAELSNDGTVVFAGAVHAVTISAELAIELES